MKTKTLLQMLCVLSATCFSSCQDENFLEPQLGYDAEKNELNSLNTDVSETTAMNVATKFMSVGLSSRATTENAVKNITEILDPQSRTALYVVNFDEGFVIVSASKKSEPIQAFSYTGSFKINPQSPSNCIINELVDCISIRRNQEFTDSITSLWAPLLNPEELSKPESRSNAESDMLDAKGDMRAQLQREGYTVYDMSEPLNLQDIPKAVRDKFYNILEHNGFWYEETGMELKKAALLAVKSSSTTRESVLCKTKWHQCYPYNGNTNVNLGCYTVAVAQFMKIHQRPTTLEWNKMPDEMIIHSQSPTLVNFLQTLKKELKVNSNGGTTQEEALKVLKSYGYNVSAGTSASGYPCITSGVDSYDGMTGHAWLIDGFRSSQGETVYKLYMPSETRYPQFVYFCENTYTELSSGPFYEHMIWGEAKDLDGNNNNGFYLNNNLKIKFRTKIDGRDTIIFRNYNLNRKYINLK